MMPEKFEKYFDKYDLQNRDPTSDEYFRTVLHIATTEYGMVERDLAHGLCVSRPTIKRWLTGENLPHRAMRKPVLEWIVKNV